MSKVIVPANRDSRQAIAIDWSVKAFGEAVATDKKERALRFLEEAIELAQACGIEFLDIPALAAHVYGKPVGEVAQEVGGVGVTLLILCQNLGLSAEDCEWAELKRILTLGPAHFTARQDAKAAAGVARKSEVPA